MNIEALSIRELKQMLARVNHDLKLNKPTLKRIKQEAVPVPSEGAICNDIAKRFTNKQYAPPVQNAKIIADIAIQRDILDYLNNGGRIITRSARGSKRKPIAPLSVISYHKVSL